MVLYTLVQVDGINVVFALERIIQAVIRSKGEGAVILGGRETSKGCRGQVTSTSWTVESTLCQAATQRMCFRAGLRSSGTRGFYKL